MISPTDPYKTACPMAWSDIVSLYDDPMTFEFSKYPEVGIYFNAFLQSENIALAIYEDK
jgi:hypothetical protein